MTSTIKTAGRDKMNSVSEKLTKCYESVRSRTGFTPKAALILGSGLGDYADGIRVEDTLDYHDIGGFPVSTVQGHKGRFIFGYVGEVPVVCMQGRIHYYEGYEMSDVVLPVRLMKMMGAETLFLTNAAGGGFYADQRSDCKLCPVTAARTQYRRARRAVSGYESDI